MYFINTFFWVQKTISLFLIFFFYTPGFKTCFWIFLDFFATWEILFDFFCELFSRFLKLFWLILKLIQFNLPHNLPHVISGGIYIAMLFTWPCWAITLICPKLEWRARDTVLAPRGALPAHRNIVLRIYAIIEVVPAPL